MLRTAQGDVQMVFIQLMVDDLDVFGGVIKGMPPKVESAGEWRDATGVPMADIQGPPGCSLSRFISYLKDRNYLLVTVHYYEKPGRGRAQRNKQYIARFGFAVAQLASFFKMEKTPELRADLLVDLERVCKGGRWKGVRVFNNQFFDLVGRDGQEPTREALPGQRTLEVAAAFYRPVDSTERLLTKYLGFSDGKIDTVMA